MDIAEKNFYVLTVKPYPGTDPVGLSQKQTNAWLSFSPGQHGVIGDISLNLGAIFMDSITMFKAYQSKKVLSAAFLKAQRGSFILY